MSAISKFLLALGIALGATGCSTDANTDFSGTCDTSATGGGCGSLGTGASAGVSGNAGTGGGAGALGSGGTPGASGTGGGAGTPASSDAGSPPPAKCPATGGGVSLTPPGSCTVLAYCGTGATLVEFRLVCRDGAPTCDCKTKGITQKSIANDRPYCQKIGDGGTRPNLDEAAAACGWSVDTSTFQN